jgi:YVTN family beta-propeller protein
VLASDGVAPAGAYEFRILGPFEVLQDGRALQFAPGKEQALLAVLVLHQNERVSIDRLTDLLWDEAPPESAQKMIRIYVSRLRRALAANGAEQRLVTQAAGYRLRVEPDELDLDRFERLLGKGRAALADGDPSLAEARLRDAGSLWRGPSLAGLSEARFLEQESARLDELRLSAREERIEAQLALGEGSELLDELETLVREHPLRERPAAQLMRALYRAGRQADALTIYKQTRDRLVDELGIEPGRALKELEQAILRQDPALEPAAKRGAHPPQPSLVGESHTLRSTRTMVLTAVSAIAIAAAAVIAVALSGNGHKRIRLVSDAVGVLRGGRLADQGHIGVAPSALAVGAGAIWIASSDANSVSRLDAKTLGVRQTIPVGDGPSGVAVGGGAVWVANGLDGTVSRIDPRANKVVQTTQVGSGPVAIAYGLGSVWVANRSDQTVSRVDPHTGDVLETLAAGTDAAAIAAGYGAVWVVDQARGRIARLEPGSTAPVLTINVGNDPSAVALGKGSVWVANTLDSTVSRIDPRSNRVVATIPVGPGPSGLAVADDGVWVANVFDGTLARIGSQSKSVDRRIRLRQRPVAATAAAGSVFVAVGASPTSHRGGTLTIAGSDVQSVDPARAYASAAWATVILTSDGLTTFKRIGGIEGTQVVPDLATDLPTPTDGGRTYTFRLRRGIRYSNGRVVRPEDFRRALERDIVANQVNYYNGVIGARACAARPNRCDLSRGVVSEDRAWTVTFHLRAPDPDFLYKLALPFASAVPVTTPDKDLGRHPPPATGPYRVAKYKPGRWLKLVRNPHFRVWSQAAQPDGYPDAIVWKLGNAPVAQARSVEAGTADVAFDSPGFSPGLISELETRYASQLRLNPIPRTTYMFLNTRVPPFDDVRVRRALNYAVDRTIVVRALGGPDLAQPTCQFLPPGFPGYRPYCPYTVRPGPPEMWIGPDLARARRLVEESGTRGASVTVWIPSDRRLGSRVREGAFAVPLLKQLGYRARVKHLGGEHMGGDYYATAGDSRLKAQAGVQSWGADYPAPWNFFFLLSCRSFVPGTGRNPNFSEFCDPRIDRQIARARALQATDPALASSLWTSIDHKVVDQAPVVPLVNPKQVDFISRRVGNYQYSPQWGALLDQLWVR